MNGYSRKSMGTPVRVPEFIMLRRFLLLTGIICVVSLVPGSTRTLVEITQSPVEPELRPCEATFRPIALKADEALRTGKYDVAIAEFNNGLRHFHRVPFFEDIPCYLEYYLYFKNGLISGYLHKEDPASLARAKMLVLEMLPKYAFSHTSEYLETRDDFKDCAVSVAEEIEIEDTADAKFILRQLLTLPFETAGGEDQSRATEAYLRFRLGSLIATEGKKGAREEAINLYAKALSQLDKLTTGSWAPWAWTNYEDVSYQLAWSQFTQDDLQAAMQTIDRALRLINDAPASAELQLNAGMLEMLKSSILQEYGKFDEAASLLESAINKFSNTQSEDAAYIRDLQLLCLIQKIYLMKITGDRAKAAELKRQLRDQIPEDRETFAELTWDAKSVYFYDRFDEAIDEADAGNPAGALEILDKIKPEVEDQMAPGRLVDKVNKQLLLMDFALVQFGLTGDEAFKFELDKYHVWCKARPDDMSAVVMLASYQLLVNHDASAIEDYKKAGFPVTVSVMDSWLWATRAAKAPALADTERWLVEELKRLGVAEIYLDSGN